MAKIQKKDTIEVFLIYGTKDVTVPMTDDSFTWWYENKLMFLIYNNGWEWVDSNNYVPLWD